MTRLQQKAIFILWSVLLLVPRLVHHLEVKAAAEVQMRPVVIVIIYTLETSEHPSEPESTLAVPGLMVCPSCFGLDTYLGCGQIAAKGEMDRVPVFCDL